MCGTSPVQTSEFLHPLDYFSNPITMRYPAEQKAETHEKILATAARSFREHGSERNGIGQVMQELGLTKGGFYRHFDSKGDLYAAALARAFEELGNRMIAVAEAAPEDKRLRVMIEDYLSAKHLNTPGNRLSTGSPGGGDRSSTT